MRMLCLALIAGVLSPPPHAGTETVRALILTGESDHAWKDTTVRLKRALEDSGYFRVDVCDDPEAPVLSDPDALRNYAVLVLNFNRAKRWDVERESNFLSYVRGGGGLVVVHAAAKSFGDWDEFGRLIGGAWRDRGTAFPNRGSFHPPTSGPIEVAVVDPNHAITAGLGSSFTVRDEMSANLKLQPDIHVLARGAFGGKPQPLIFIRHYGKGRVFQTALGHDLVAIEHPKFKDTLIRGARWAAGVLGLR